MQCLVLYDTLKARWAQIKNKRQSSHTLTVNRYKIPDYKTGKTITNDEIGKQQKPVNTLRIVKNAKPMRDCLLFIQW